MNVMTQICGIIVLLVVIFSYRRQRKLQLRTGRAFLVVWSLSVINLVLDILSLICIAYQDDLPQIVVNSACKTYVSTLVWAAVVGIFYICADIFGHSKMYRRMVVVCSAIAIIGNLAIYALPIYIMTKENSNVAYTYGPSILMTYGLAVSYLVVMVILILKYGGQMNPKRREGVRIWLSVWFLAAVIQFINNEILIVSFACAIGVLVIYMKLENPETNIDRRTGMFNESAFLQYAKQMNEQNKKFYLLSMSYTQGSSENIPSDIDTKVKMELVSLTMKAKEVSLFRGTGDYVVFLCSSEKKASELVEKLRIRFEKPWKNAYLIPHFAYISDTGIAKEEKDLFSLIRYVYNRENAYAEKDFIHIDEKIAMAMYEELEMEKLITEAMEQNRVEVFYQPIYSTREKKFVSAEALVRIRREDGSIVPPGMFINVAEKKGMIIQLGKIVFENVCRFLKENDLGALGLRYVEVNLSVVQCGYADLADEFMQIMDKYQIKPEWINLEITESASLKKKQILLDNMEVLREFGIDFSLDDFGTGQSNLNYIVDMPVDIVKFDREMIKSYFENDKAKYVLDAAMLMIQGLNLEIVSEGIETKEQYQVMEDLGIHYIQGFYFSKPLQENEFIGFLKMKNN